MLTAVVACCLSLSGPLGNRPLDAAGDPLQFFEMSDPRTTPAGTLPDPFLQAPLMLGDFINYHGTLMREVTDPLTVRTAGAHCRSLACAADDAGARGKLIRSPSLCTTLLLRRETASITSARTPSPRTRVRWK